MLTDVLKSRLVNFDLFRIGVMVLNHTISTIIVAPFSRVVA